MIFKSRRMLLAEVGICRLHKLSKNNTPTIRILLDVLQLRKLHYMHGLSNCPEEFRRLFFISFILKSNFLFPFSCPPDRQQLFDFLNSKTDVIPILQYNFVWLSLIAYQNMDVY